MTALDGELVAGTAEDLVADALVLGLKRASTRMVKDWVENGLLAHPRFCKSTQRGSDLSLFPPDQRMLFRKIIEGRLRSPLARVPHHTVVPVIISMWLYGDPAIADDQARRALRTYAKKAGANTAARRKATARAVVDQFAHPDAPRGVRLRTENLLIDGERRRDPDWGELRSAMEELAAPWRHYGLPRLDERTLGLPEAPVTFDYAVAIWMLKSEVRKRLETESLGPAPLLRARAEFSRGWAEYQRDREGLAARAGTNSTTFTAPADLEAHAREHVDSFISTLGRTAGYADPIFRQAGLNVRRA
ncbi:hypothetical protein ACFVVU_22550 [Kitasatospora sp. NPDC057965]|uniref:hypothetical protein n=1 Tax=Kitasatospora sp. NPDC057965 TaxID=3346291 RepID=UPI0036DAC89A